MSETIQAVFITGIVTLAATYIGPLLAARSARQLSAEERRSTAARELRPLAIEAIEHTRRTIALCDKELSAIDDGQGALAEFDTQSPDDPRGQAGAQGLRSARAAARAALTELELATDDPAIQIAVTSLLNLLEGARVLLDHERYLAAKGTTEPMQGQDIRATIYQTRDAVTALKVALQPATTLQPSGKKMRRLDRQVLAFTREQLSNAENDIR